MRGTDIIAYTGEADTWCPVCAASKFGTCQRSPGGREIWEPAEACNVCGALGVPAIAHRLARHDDDQYHGHRYEPGGKPLRCGVIGGHDHDDEYLGSRDVGPVFGYEADQWREGMICAGCEETILEATICRKCEKDLVDHPKPLEGETETLCPGEYAIAEVRIVSAILAPGERLRIVPPTTSEIVSVAFGTTEPLPADAFAYIEAVDEYGASHAEDILSRVARAYASGVAVYSIVNVHA